MTRLLGLALALCCLVAAGPTPPVAAADDLPPHVVVTAPSVSGTARFGRIVVADPGTWKPAPTGIRYQWRRDGRAIRDANGRGYEIRVGDVGHRLSVTIDVRAPGYALTTRTVSVGLVKHRVDVRRVVRYSVRTKGTVRASVATFKVLAQETYDDPRGWRGRGVQFVRVSSGGAFTLWLSEAGRVPGFSSVCSAQWSCRVGRNVIINVQRWQHASTAWNRAGRSLRDYRHMVVNHETGHWLGKGHASCPRRGALAPVMMQQSKGTGGCRFNPWPTLSELRR